MLRLNGQFFSAVQCLALFSALLLTCPSSQKVVYLHHSRPRYWVEACGHLHCLVTLPLEKKPALAIGWTAQCATEQVWTLQERTMSCTYREWKPVRPAHSPSIQTGVPGPILWWTIYLSHVIY
jgi:hypothetical protein